MNHMKIGQFDLNGIYNIEALKGLKLLPNDSVDFCMTSPPYWFARDYGSSQQIGLEISFNEYVLKLFAIFSELKRVLKPTGSFYLNIADRYGSMVVRDNILYEYEKGQSYTEQRKQVAKNLGLSTKTLLGIPWRLAIMMIDNGWILKNHITWIKTGLPFSGVSRFTTLTEDIFFFVKNDKTLLWYNKKTGEFVNKKPDKVSTTCHICNGTGLNPYIDKFYIDKYPNLPDYIKYCFKCEGRKEVILWKALDYYFDLDSVREEPKTQSALTDKQRKNRYMEWIRDNKKALDEGEDFDKESPFVGKKTIVNRPINMEFNKKGKNPGDIIYTSNANEKDNIHYASFPISLVVPFIKASCPPKGIVFDMFQGSGSTLLAAALNDRPYLGFDINGDYCEYAKQRIKRELANQQFELKL